MRRKLYVGSVGPFLYDDATPIGDQDGDFAGMDRHAFVTDGQLLVETTPSEDNHVLRLIDLGGIDLRAVAVADIDNPVELAGFAGIASTLLLAYQLGASENLWTIYGWDNAVAAGADSPWVVAGSSGFWIAIAGRYHRGVMRIGQGGNYTNVEEDGDLEFIGSAGLIAGGMYAFQSMITVTVPAKLLWFEVLTGLNARYEHHVTFQNDHELLIEVDGIYEVHWSMKMESVVPSDDIVGCLGVNGTADQSTGGQYSGHGFLNLSAADVVSLFVMNESGGRNVTVSHATVTIAHIGGISLATETQAPTTVVTTATPTTPPPTTAPPTTLAPTTLAPTTLGPTTAL